jgi:hypothetical protein
VVVECIRRNKSIVIMKIINELEERLIAPGFPFLQIREPRQIYRKPAVKNL